MGDDRKIFRLDSGEMVDIETLLKSDEHADDCERDIDLARAYLRAQGKCPECGQPLAFSAILGCTNESEHGELYGEKWAEALTSE